MLENCSNEAVIDLRFASTLSGWVDAETARITVSKPILDSLFSIAFNSVSLAALILGAVVMYFPLTSVPSVGLEKRPVRTPAVISNNSFLMTSKKIL